MGSCSKITYCIHNLAFRVQKAQMIAIFLENVYIYLNDGKSVLRFFKAALLWF